MPRVSVSLGSRARMALRSRIASVSTAPRSIPWAHGRRITPLRASPEKSFRALWGKNRCRKLKTPAAKKSSRASAPRCANQPRVTNPVKAGPIFAPSPTARSLSRRMRYQYYGIFASSHSARQRRRHKGMSWRRSRQAKSSFKILPDLRALAAEWQDGRTIQWSSEGSAAKESVTSHHFTLAKLSWHKPAPCLSPQHAEAAAPRSLRPFTSSSRRLISCCLISMPPWRALRNAAPCPKIRFSASSPVQAAPPTSKKFSSWARTALAV